MGVSLALIMSSVLFMGLILLCFAYTIFVIFRQKKVGEMKTDFINNMTHEFKTPIATISLAADSITSPKVVESVDKIKRFASIIKQENRRMLSQVEKVLQMALIDKKDFKLKWTNVDVHQVINEAVGNIGLQVQKRLGTVHTDLQATLSMIQGDANPCFKYHAYLLDNANKYTTEKPEILVSTKNVSTGVQVSIRDNGIGLSPEAKSKYLINFIESIQEIYMM